MVKKTLLASFLLALLPLAAANAGNLYFAPGFALTNVSSNSGNFRGLTPRITFGYLARPSFDGLLGTEVFFGVFSLPFKETHLSGYSSVKTTHDLGVSLLPGVMINDEMQVFLRLGVVSSRFTATGTSVLGKQVGMGLQTSLSKSFDLRMEYDFTDYNTLRAVGRAQADNFMVGIVYNWG